MDDCLLCIFNYLPLTEILNCFPVCKQFNTIANNNFYWSQKYKSTFGCDLKYTEAQTKYKQYYTLHTWILKKTGKFRHNFLITTSLELNDLGLKSVPSEIGYLTKLKKLYLCNDALESITEKIGLLTNLEYLLLSKNNLHNLPSTIGLLTNLKELSLFDNNLNLLPKTIKNLTSLRELSFANNLFESIPKEIKNLTDLEVLSIANNPLKSFHQEIGLLPNLKSLIIDESQNTITFRILQLLQYTAKYSVWIANQPNTSIPSPEKD